MKATWNSLPALILCPALVLCLSSGCKRTSPPAADSQEMQIRTYTVPAGLDAAELRGFLRDVLARGDQVLGSVQVFGDGSLVVTAPVSVQEGVVELLRQLESRGSAAASAPTAVAVNYWVLLGASPAAGAKAVASSEVALQHLRPVLEQIVAAEGPTEFHLLEHARLHSLQDSGYAELRGRHVTVNQRISSRAAGEALADIRITMPGKFGVGVVHDLNSRIKLEPGKFIVLGQTAYNGQVNPVPKGLEPSDGLRLYYVIATDPQ